MKKNIENGKILTNTPLVPGVYQMVLQTKRSVEVSPGQFLNLYCKDGSRLLPRAISICEVVDEKSLRLVYKTVGEGTREFSKLAPGEEIEYLGPLGKGFDLPTKTDREILIIGGGVGVPPLLELAKRLTGNIKVLLGFETRSILVEDFKKQATEVAVATASGEEGIRGTVMDLLETEGYTPDIIYSCGPKGMLRAVQSWAASRSIPAQLSLEERMACGIGACLVCSCKTKEGPDPQDWSYRRVCKDGPVFNGEEVVFE